MKASHVMGIIIALILIIFAACYPVPKKDINVSSSSYAYDYPWSKNWGAEYVGGDAYNYQMEASLKAGYMAGVLAMKTLMFVSGILLLFSTLYSNHKSNLIEEQTSAISLLNTTLLKQNASIETCAKNTAAQQTLLKDINEVMLSLVASSNADPQANNKSNEQ